MGLAEKEIGIIQSLSKRDKKIYLEALELRAKSLEKGVRKMSKELNEIKRVLKNEKYLKSD